MAEITRRIMRNDLGPAPKVAITEGGSPYDLTNATIQFILWLESSLVSAIDDAVTTIEVPSSDFTDIFFELTMELLVDRERMTIGGTLPTWPYTGNLSLTVARGAGTTVAAAHAQDAVVRFFKVEAAGAIDGTPTLGIAKYEWAAGDTDQAGTYKCQFEITPTGNAKFSVPVTDTFQIVVQPDADDK